MPLTLYRYILLDLLRLGALATAVLVVVMSFGAAIKPISEGLLGPWELIRVILYLMPAMLTYALPFAAAFAATLVFFRLSTDNEITACSASGISYASLCLPVLVIGVALTLSLFYMSNWIVPLFWKQVTLIVEKDVTQLMVQQIQRREPVEFSDRIILFANTAYIDNSIQNAEAPNAASDDRRIVFEGVAAGEIDPDTGQLQTAYTGELAVADLKHYGDQLFVSVKLRNATVKDPTSGTLVDTDSAVITGHAINLPLGQSPKFLSLNDLIAMRENPDLSAVVREDRQKLLKALVEQHAAQRIFQILQNKAQGPLQLLGAKDEMYLVEAPRTQLADRAVNLLSTPDAKVVVRLVGRQWLEAESGRITMTASEGDDEPRINIILKNVKVSDWQTRVSNSLSERHIPLLRLNGPQVAEPLLHKSSFEMLAEVPAKPNQSVATAAGQLATRINRLRREIVSRLNERAAMAVSCLMVMILASVMAMRLRGQTPLTIFFWCFLPTILCVVIIHSGQNTMKSDSFSLTAAAAVMWAGNAMLAAITAWIYLRLRRN